VNISGEREVSGGHSRPRATRRHSAGFEPDDAGYPAKHLRQVEERSEQRQAVNAWAEKGSKNFEDTEEGRASLILGAVPLIDLRFVSTGAYGR